MATLASTNLTLNLAPGNLMPVADEGDGLYIEVFRLAGTGTAGDTFSIVPSLYMGDIRYVSGNLPCSDNLATSVNSSVTLTQAVTNATDATTTYLVEVIGRRAT
jgi:hypothetical protein